MTDIYGQQALDDISARLIRADELIELHFIYCPCERCMAARNKEKESK